MSLIILYKGELHCGGRKGYTGYDVTTGGGDQQGFDLCVSNDSVRASSMCYELETSFFYI